MKKVIVMLSLFAISSAAFAGHCPRDARAIDAGLSKANITADQRAQIENLKTEGMALHSSGDHSGAENTLAEAMRLLLESMESADHMGM